MKDKIQNVEIPELVRVSRGSSVAPRIVKYVTELYGKPVRTKPTKKGEWRIHERLHYASPSFLESEEEVRSNGFCVIYHDGEDRTLFRGDLKERVVVDQTIEVLTQNVIEQKRFTWPPRGLTAEKGGEYGQFRGLGLTAVGVSGGLIMGIDTEPVQRLFEYFNESANPNFSYITVLSAVFMSIGGGMFVGNRLGKRMGRLADERRMRDLPEEANGFLYGPHAKHAIRDEGWKLEEERGKEEAYQRFRKVMGPKLVEGSEVSKEDYLEIKKALRV